MGGNKDVRELLVDVWREACRHIELEQSAHNIARILTHWIPLEDLLVVEFDPEHTSVVLRASALSSNESFSASSARSYTLNSEFGEKLKSWQYAQRVTEAPADELTSELVARLMGDAAGGFWLAGPLAGEHGGKGALVCRAQAPERFTQAHRRVVEAMLEPFAVALENDRRLVELRMLRDAAEADKRSALTRLGRDELADTIVGFGGGLAPVMERVEIVAPSDLPVLILGETGAGKELIARAIHDRSPRARGPFLRVNCGAIPGELIDSQLFGHEKGAFTGAQASSRGWFERAHEGTLLLDEIGELPLPAQVRLLRVLQEGTFERVGGESPIRVNVRIVAATHRDLPAMAQQGTFRQDLWYRIAGFPILLPPLRERRHDIADLAAHFARRAARRFGLRPCAATPRDLQLLQSYDWPGNVRELASVIDRAALLGGGLRLAVEQALGAAVAPAAQVPEVRLGGQARAPEVIVPLDRAMRGHIERALEHTRGRIEGAGGAAQLLRINPHTLRARMRKLGIDWSRYRTDLAPRADTSSG
jgi:hydrogenase-4 transcriptional activator